MPIKKFKAKQTEMDIDSLIPYENNVKIHDDEQVSRIAQAIQNFGWTKPIEIDENNVIICGHGRRLAAIKLGMKKVPVNIIYGMTEDEKKAYRLADNKVAESGTDLDKFQIELMSFDTDVSDILGGIYSDKELDFTVADLGETNDSAFMDDIIAATDYQKEHVEDRISDFDKQDKGVISVLGFKKFPGNLVPYVTRFVAKVQADSGISDPAVAFGEYCKQCVGE